MSPGDGNAGRCERSADVAAYVLGALEPQESEQLSRHLESCSNCREECAALQAVADTLPLSAPQLQAPRRLRRAVMASARAEPRRDSAAASGARGMRSLARPRALAVGALAAACVAIAAALLSSGGSSATRVVQASVSGPSGSALLRINGNAAELSVRGMPAAPAGKIYEVWLKRAGQPPAPTDALFGVTAAGAAAVAVPGNLHGVREVLVTPEPLGGSRTPTHMPVIVARLS